MISLLYYIYVKDNKKSEVHVTFVITNTSSMPIIVTTLFNHCSQKFIQREDEQKVPILITGATIKQNLHMYIIK